jgi:hypothetical protein
MSRNSKRKLGPFVPVMKRLLETPAWRAMSMGARVLHTELRGQLRNDGLNNGTVFRSCRDAARALGAAASSVVRWYAELKHYGFVRETTPGFLGGDGMGIAAKYRFTDLPHGTHQPTRDFERWDGTAFQYAPCRKRTQKQNPVRKKRTPSSHNAHIGNLLMPASVCTQNAHIDLAPDRSHNAHGDDTQTDRGCE